MANPHVCLFYAFVYFIQVHDAEITARQQGLGIPKYLYPASSDKSVLRYRKWWVKNCLSTKTPPNTFGPSSPDILTRLSRKQQTDPWRCHTRHCVKCRTVLSRLKKVQTLSLFLGAFSALVARRYPLVSGLCLLAGIFGRHRVHRLVLLLEGHPTPSTVGDRSLSAES